MNLWKSNWEETKKHYIDWWNHKGIVLNMWEHFQQGVKPHADIPAPHPPRDLNQKWFDPQWRADYLDWYVAHSSMKADMFPVANTQLGPGSLAAILGGVFEGGEDTIWIHPNPDFDDKILFDENHPNWKLHKDLLRACKAKSNGHYFVGMPDLMEGMDVLAAIKGTDKVLLDTVMQPDVLEHQMQQINDIYFKVFDELYDIIREGDEMAFCYFSSWAPGKMTKLQSDISTMISEDDYRRFVQPFIRQQCQHIDYTLYHLDGVGAMHHLPALLEIEELNAIQWTPGVGEPQGGSPKWYDLYKKILAGGKSIMACWVTVDELKPLLDNIGADGVHLEMDFHNEEEVERAFRIVEEYRTAPSKQPDNEDEIIRTIIEKVESRFVTHRSPLEEMVKQRILVLDGAMGTMIQQYDLKEEDFRGKQFADAAGQLKGCNDLLNLTRPDVISDIHRKYLEAGADIIETNTFNAQRISMQDYHLEAHCREINLAACRIARKLADEYTQKNPLRPRLVAGSVGPTSKTCSMCSDMNNPAARAMAYDELLAVYREQIEALLDGGVDAILIETIFDTLNAKAAAQAAQQAMELKGRTVPIMLSLTLADIAGRTLAGQDIDAFLASISGMPIFSVGLNCSFGAEQMVPFLRELAAKAPYYISAYPNAGLPNQKGEYEQTPEKMQAEVWTFIDEHLVNIVGGCCGTTEAHITKYQSLIHPADDVWISPHVPVAASANTQLSGLKAFEWEASKGMILAGDTLPDSASVQLIKDKKWDAVLNLARTQVENGANLLNINIDEVGGNLREQMTQFVNLLQSDPSVASVPMMISSSSAEVVCAGLKCLQGKSVANGLDLKLGDAELLKIATEYKQLGAAIMLSFPIEKNTQITTDVCKHAYQLLTEKAGYSPCDIIFSPIVPPLPDIDALKAYKDTIQWLKMNYRQAHIAADLSTLIKQPINEIIRALLQDAFLQSAGVDMAIMNVVFGCLPAKANQVVKGDVEAFDSLLQLSSVCGTAAANHATSKTKESTSSKPDAEAACEDVFDAILKGKADLAVEATRRALDAGVEPQAIINNHMIRAMSEVGRRFQEGKAFVPQLLMAGRAMKGALELLKPMLKGNASITIGKIVIGTVKGDLHDIGKNLVASMLEGCGFEVVNIGIDVPSEKFIEALKETKADILCMSALLTTTMTYMQDVIQAMEDVGIRSKVKVMVGGAPVSQAFADEIGADGYSDNANSAVALAKRLMQEKE